MTWLEWVRSVSNPLCFATATTGIAADSELIAFAWVSEEGPNLCMRKVPVEELLPAEEYHQICPTLMGSLGDDDAHFKGQLQDLFRNHTGFTYNVRFQQGKLEAFVENPDLVDLCVLVKGAESHVCVPESATNSIQNMMRFLTQDRHINRVPFKDMLANRDIDATTPLGVLPVEHNADCLWQLLKRLSDYEIIQ